MEVETLLEIRKERQDLIETYTVLQATWVGGTLPVLDLLLLPPQKKTSQCVKR